MLYNQSLERKRSMNQISFEDLFEEENKREKVDVAEIRTLYRPYKRTF